MKKQSSFQPFIAVDKIVPEITWVSVVLGILLAVIFGAANAYLGLRVGVTVSASIPAAVISMGVIRVILKRESLLENNLVQTIGSAGESVAAGAIFTLPALFMWMEEWNEGVPSLVEISLIALCGGILGVLFMVPLRQALIVKEHGVLPYPEGTACAEVLIAGEEGGAKAGGVFAGMGIAAVYKFVADGLKLFPSDVDFEISKYGGGVGISTLPALAGVGYICGSRIVSYMMAGGIISWLILMPLIKLFGNGLTEAFAPATDVLISEMSSSALWSSYIRYIGAGAVATAGIISLVKALPLIFGTFKEAMKNLKAGRQTSTLRTDRDLSMKLVLGGVLVAMAVIWLVPAVPVNLVGAFLIAVFGFLFATVSSRLVGLVGSSNNPVSGMTIATLLVSSLVLKAVYGAGHESMMGVIAIGGVICIIAAVAGDTSQDLKTGYLVGSTPVKQQVGELIGVVASAVTIGGVLYLLNQAWGYGSTELPAPQAMIMKTVVEGVMNGNLPWNLILVGAAIAVVIEILGIPVMPVAVGIYLPFRTTAAIMAGGLLRLWFEKRKIAKEERKETIDRGILYASGMIAGEGLVGILLAVFAIVPFVSTRGGYLADFLDLSALDNTFGAFLVGSSAKLISLVAFVLLLLIMCRFTIWHKEKKNG